MSENLILELEKRDYSKNPRQLRADGSIPVTIYGKGVESVSAQVNARVFARFYKKNKDAAVELKLEDQSIKGFVKKAQKEIIGDNFLNIEFCRVSA